MDQNLSNQLFNAYEYLTICENYDYTIEEYEHKIDIIKNKYQEIKNESPDVFAGFMKLVGSVNSFAALVIITIVVACVKPILIPFIIALDVVIVAIFMKKRKKEKSKPTKKAEQFLAETGNPIISKCKTALEELNSEYRAFMSKHSFVLDFLPPDYRNMNAVCYISHLIDNGIVDTLQEALKEYIQEKRIQDMQAKIDSTLQNSQVQAQLFRDEMMSKVNAMTDEQKRANSKLRDIENITLNQYINDRYN